MYIQQLYTNCLAEAAYYIESNGEAAIIDPLRETQPYIDLARQRGAKIKYVFETHFHADFVSGHIDLVRETGALIIYGPGAKADYNIYAAKDLEDFKLGAVTLRVLHTPGHTMESSCFLLIDEQNNPAACFTGDTLFVGDVGRPDLAVKSDLSREDLAGYLYDSIQSKIVTLPDEVIVYPGHGAGSACGKNLGKETWSTIGQQKKLNYALQAKSREEFIRVVTDGLTTPPAYFFMDAAINKKGYEPIEDVMKRNAKSLSPTEFERLSNDGAIILDTRDGSNFVNGYIPGSINIGLGGQYAVWVGSILKPSTPLILVAPLGKEDEAVLRLARVGYENVKGVLQGGFDAWKDSGRPVERILSVQPYEFEQLLKEGENILDVRNESEWADGVANGAKLISLLSLEKELPLLTKDERYYVYCAGGYRSVIAASLMKREGFTNVVNIEGGMTKMRKEGIQISLPETIA